jgi:hypothetical protein
MASTPTSRRWAGLARRTLGAGAAVAVTAAATLVLATPASAHTPKVEAFCEEGTTTLKVNLTNYNTTHGNFLTVVADDEVIIDGDDFGASFQQKWDDFDGTVDHVFVVEVDAWDDQDGSKGWSFSETLDVEACAVAPTTTSEVAPTTTDEAAPTTTDEVAPTTSPAGGESGGLADTGASIAIPLVLGVLLLAGGGVLLLIVRRRGNSNA